MLLYFLLYGKFRLLLDGPEGNAHGQNNINYFLLIGSLLKGLPFRSLMGSVHVCCQLLPSRHSQTATVYYQRLVSGKVRYFATIGGLAEYYYPMRLT